MSTSIAIDMDWHATRYGTIHKAGCRDLKDGMPLGTVDTIREAELAADDGTGWGYEPGEWTFAPCVHLPHD